MTASWIEVLRAACAASTQPAIAARIHYSTTVVNQVLKGSYKGNLQRIERAVQGALMGSVVDCPVVGSIPQQKCMEHQRAPFRATNHMAVQLYNACRGGCPHSLIKVGTTDKETS
jgi:hypothetical protein